MSDIKIRQAVKADAEAIAKIHIAGWRSSYGGLVEQDYLDELSIEEKSSDWSKWLSEDTVQVLMAETGDGTACGFSGFGKLRTPIPGMSPIRPLYTGELYALYIMEEFWRQGIGTKLMGKTARVLLDMKHKSMSLWVLKKNKRAVSFYKDMGGQRCGKKPTTIGNTELLDVAFGWRDTTALRAL